MLPIRAASNEAGSAKRSWSCPIWLVTKNEGSPEVGESFEAAAVTVDWFHVVQLFTKAVDAVRRAEARQNKLPKALR